MEVVVSEMVDVEISEVESESEHDVGGRVFQETSKKSEVGRF